MIVIKKVIEIDLKNNIIIDFRAHKRKRILQKLLDSEIITTK